MTSIENPDTWIGRTAVDNSGEQIGVITEMWVDDASGDPAWASVKLIVQRGRKVLVPLAGAAAYGGGRRFAYGKESILDAPQCAEDGRLEVDDMERLTAYYGTPETAPDPGSTSWVDRLEDAADGANVREIRALLGEAHSAPAPQAPVARKASRRFGRKAAPSGH